MRSRALLIGLLAALVAGAVAFAAVSGDPLPDPPAPIELGGQQDAGEGGGPWKRAGGARGDQVKAGTGDPSRSAVEAQASATEPSAEPQGSLPQSGGPAVGPTDGDDNPGGSDDNGGREDGPAPAPGSSDDTPVPVRPDPSSDDGLTEDDDDFDDGQGADDSADGLVSGDASDG